MQFEILQRFTTVSCFIVDSTFTHTSIVYFYISSHFITKMKRLLMVFLSLWQLCDSLVFFSGSNIPHVQLTFMCMRFMYMIIYHVTLCVTEKRNIRTICKRTCCTECMQKRSSLDAIITCFNWIHQACNVAFAQYVTLNKHRLECKENGAQSVKVATSTDTFASWHLAAAMTQIQNTKFVDHRETSESS